LPNPKQKSGCTNGSTHDVQTGIMDVIWQPIEKRVADELSKEQTQRKLNYSLQQNHAVQSKN